MPADRGTILSMASDPATPSRQPLSRPWERKQQTLSSVWAIDEDRELSPYTGWTREHWEATLDATLDAVRPYASPRHALIDLPGPVSISGRRSDGLEGFARTFLAAGFRLARKQEGNGILAEWYASGL